MSCISFLFRSFILKLIPSARLFWGVISFLLASHFHFCDCFSFLLLDSFIIFFVSFCFMIYVLLFSHLYIYLTFLFSEFLLSPFLPSFLCFSYSFIGSLIPDPGHSFLPFFFPSFPSFLYSSIIFIHSGLSCYLPWFTSLSFCSYLLPFLISFILSWINSPAHSFFLSFLAGFLPSSFPSFPLPVQPLFIPSFVHSFTHLFCPFLPSLIHSFIY